MDINLPGMDGIAGVSELSKLLPDTFFIMLTVRDNTDAVFNSMAAGACGYLHKPVTGAKLAEAAHEVVAGGSPMSAKIARLVVQAFKKPAPAEVKKSPAEALTTREQDVLDQLMGGYSYKDVAANLAISPHTVHFHIRTIYKKLQVRSRAEAVAKVMKR
jgi:DNA-binding NarL/FixJ family response regulator